MQKFIVILAITQNGVIGQARAETTESGTLRMFDKDAAIKYALELAGSVIENVIYEHEQPEAFCTSAFIDVEDYIMIHSASFQVRIEVQEVVC